MLNEAPPVLASGTSPARTFVILVADDNPVVRILISKLLTKRGHRAEFVVDGRQAVAAAQQASHDLILMDMDMPEMDGIAATRAIRRLDGPQRAVPIIALTGRALAGQHETCLAAGMSDYLSKPFDAADLYAMIDRWGASTWPDTPVLQAR